MQHIQRMIDQHGGFEAVQRNYLRIENEPFMRLVIEVIGGHADLTIAVPGALLQQIQAGTLVPLAITGIVTPLIAALVMASSSLIVIGNSLRAGRSSTWTA